MTTPAGTWDALYDASLGALPATGGTLVLFPDPANGSVGGGVWAVADQAINDTSGARSAMWTDARAITGTSGGMYISDAALYMQVTNGNYIAFMFVVPTEVVTVDSTVTYHVVETGDFSTDFHEYMLEVDGSTQRIYLDGVVIDTRTAFPYPSYPYATFTVPSAGSAEIRGIAWADVMPDIPEPELPLPPALGQIHLGATGLTIDFDEVAHYDTQLSEAQAQYHNAVGRGMA